VGAGAQKEPLLCCFFINTQSPRTQPIQPKHNSNQTDDVFLNTEFDVGLYANGRASYRLTAPHLSRHATWSKNLNTAGGVFKIDLPHNGNGVLEYVANRLANPATQALEVDDRSCIDFPEYTSLGCNCWITGTAACTSTIPFCKNCTKGGWWAVVGCACGGFVRLQMFADCARLSHMHSFFLPLRLEQAAGLWCRQGSRGAWVGCGGLHGSPVAFC
jgi:hypothetical protein